jgi:hypothetical protein
MFAPRICSAGAQAILHVRIKNRGSQGLTSAHFPDNKRCSLAVTRGGFSDIRNGGAALVDVVVWRRGENA